LNKKPKYYLWYVPQEKKHFIESDKSYDGFVIAAHILAHNKNAFTALLNSLNKFYFIDPETVFFQKTDINIFLNEKGNIRTSWKKLGAQYGSIIETILSKKRSLRPDDFVSVNGAYKNDLNDFVKRCILFQQEAIVKILSGLSRFFKMPNQNKYAPLFLVAPYFFFDSLSDPWYKINLEIIKIATTLKKHHKLYAVICTTKYFIDNEKNLKKLVNDFNAEGLDGFLIWIDDFNEAQVHANYLGSFLKLIYYLSSTGKKVINLYGSYFSVIAKFWGLDGHASGVSYRDYREVSRASKGGPAGGVIPPYYIPLFHTKVTLDEAVRFIKQFNELRCDCPICLNNRCAYDPTTKRSLKLYIMKNHFLYIKGRELEEIIQRDLDGLLHDLEGVYERYQEFYEILPISHIREWCNAIRENQFLLD